MLVDNKGEIMKQTLNKIGWKYGIYALWFLGARIVASTLISKFAPEFYEKNKYTLSCLSSLIIVYLFGMLIVWLLTKNMPKTKFEKNKYSVGKFIKIIVASFGAAGIGVIIGLPLHLLFSLPFGADPTRGGVSDLMFNGNYPLTAFLVVICAPVFEELLFRKFLIDRLAVKGKLLAILTSGICFGLFHGNFQQAFFATFLGWIFAYVYTKTGKIHYTMILHAVINGTSMFITVPLARWYLKMYDEMLANEAFASAGVTEDILLMVLAALLIIGCFLVLATLALAGVIVLIVQIANKKIVIDKNPDEEPQSKQILALVTAPGMYVFYAVMVLNFVYTYVALLLDK